MKLIIIRGQGGAGKTTLAESLATYLRKKSKVALLSADTFYWGISGEEHNDTLVFEGLQKLVELYLKNRYSVILEGMLTSKKNDSLRINSILKKGKKYHAQIHSFHLTAQPKILKSRIRTKFKKEGHVFDSSNFSKWYVRVAERRYKNETVIATDRLNKQQVLDTVFKKL